MERAAFFSAQEILAILAKACYTIYTDDSLQESEYVR